MNKSVLVTGTSTGLGLETAVVLAEQGFEVYASMRSLERSGPLKEVAQSRGVHLELLELDITKGDQICRAVDTVVSRSGSIYGLVNNAGIGLRGYFEDLADDEIRAVFEANVFGTMQMTQAVLPHMREAGEGRIAIVTSVGGRIASLGVSAYCSTKFAQEGFGEALSQEVLPFGIYISLVEPAIIKTERWGRNRGVARNANNPESPYAEWFQNSERLADWLVKSSPTTPASVARAVYRVMTARRPKLRYLVGGRAAPIFFLRRHLPAGLFERLYFGATIRRVVGDKGPK